jgi:large conductance mechanosensitive channel
VIVAAAARTSEPRHGAVLVAPSIGSRRPSWRQHLEVNVVGEFRGFLLKTNALALAIGVIIGTALGTVVNSLVNDIIMPPVGLLLGGIDFAAQRLILKAAVNGDPTTEVAIRYGAFINSLIAFVVIAFVVWRLSKMFITEEAEAETKTCPFCREANALDATKCRACASAI